MAVFMDLGEWSLPSSRQKDLHQDINVLILQDIPGCSADLSGDNRCGNKGV